MDRQEIELFVLDLSFILWILLCAVTCGLAALYVTPYATLTNSVYYDNLKYITAPQSVEPTAEFVEM